MRQSMCVAVPPAGYTDPNTGIWYPHALPALAAPGDCVPKSPPAPEVERSYGLLKSVPTSFMAVRDLSDTAAPTPNNDPLFSAEQLAFSKFYSP